MKTLEVLLEENYDELRDPDCRAAVIEYIAATPSVSDKHVLFIKRLTKVAHHIIENDSFALDGFLERLFRFNQQGIDKIKSGRLNGYSLNNLTVMVSHFHSHSGHVAREIYNQTDDLSWAKEWCKSYEASIETNKGLEPDHCYYAHQIAGIAAGKIFKRTKNMHWGKRSYDHNLASARLSVVTDEKHAAYSYAHAGDMAREMAEIEKNKGKRVELLKLAYDHYMLSADMSGSFDQKHAGHIYDHAGRIARSLFKELGNIEYARNWYEQMLLGADMLVEIEPLHAGLSYGFAADAACAMFNATDNPQWAVRWRDYHLLSADMCFEEKPKHAAHQYSFAGNASKALFEITGAKEDARMAILCYDLFIDYFTQHPVREMKQVFDIIKKDRDALLAAL